MALSIAPIMCVMDVLINQKLYKCTLELLVMSIAFYN